MTHHLLLLSLSWSNENFRTVLVVAAAAAGNEKVGRFTDGRRLASRARAFPSSLSICIPI